MPTSSGGFCQHPGKGVAELHLLAAYFQQAALGASTRQQHLAIVNSKLAAIVADPDKVSLEVDLIFAHIFRHLQVLTN